MKALVTACALVIGTSLVSAPANELHATSWYGWENACTPAAFQACASAQIRATQAANGRTILAIRLAAHTPGYWSSQSGTAIGLIFSPSLPVAADPGFDPAWVRWTSGPHTNTVWSNGWTLDLRAHPGAMLPTYGQSWVAFSIEAPFTIAESDLLGFFTETNPMYELPDGSWTYTTHQIALTDPTYYVTPEPVTMVLMGTGLLGLAAARRRSRQRGDQALAAADCA